MISNEVSNNYLDYLLHGDKNKCFEIVHTLLDKDVQIRDIYLNLFQSTLYKIGELWETNQISVATEHIATAITESLMSNLYPKIISQKHTGRKSVISCITNEYHEVGAHMIADIFEINGWDAYFLGANMPRKDLFELIEAKQPDIVGLSVSIFFNIRNFVDLFDETRHYFPNQDIIIGGQAFRFVESAFFKQFSNSMFIPSIEQVENLLTAYDQ